MNFESSFKLYQKAGGDRCCGSTLFDLFSGKGETKQTKSLAYALKSNQAFLSSFVKIFFPKAVSSLRQATYVEVIAELILANSRRADIVLKLWNKRRLLAVIVIEAKGAGVTAKDMAVINQLSGYLNFFNGDSRVGRYGATLTKNKVYSNSSISITWDEIVTLVAQQKDGRSGQDGFFKELLDYLTKVNRGMKYYEKEVLSIPAGKTIRHVEKFGVYVCPTTAAYNYAKALFVAFREAGGGKMSKLYRVDHELIVDPTECAAMEGLKNDSPEIYKKISSYLLGNPLEGEYRFFVLSDKTIPLDHEPCPKRNNAKFTYYSLQSLLDKNEKHPIPSSQEEA